MVSVHFVLLLNMLVMYLNNNVRRDVKWSKKQPFFKKKKYAHTCVYSCNVDVVSHCSNRA